MKLNELIALLRRAGARGPVSGPEKAWIVPSTAVSTLADLLEGPLLPPADHKQVDLINVEAVLLHGVFTAAELKDILAKMNAMGQGPLEQRRLLGGGDFGSPQLAPSKRLFHAQAAQSATSAMLTVGSPTPPVSFLVARPRNATTIYTG